MKKIKVVELFAGVGGFRIGLDKASDKNVKFETIFSSQWEPGTKVQHASDIYKARFGDSGHSCEDIAHVVDKKFNEIPQHDLLVGGFPCQDYSVARTLKQAEGIVGKKGVLWWSIYNILKKSGKNAPDFLMLENVDRLLKSPVSQRGRDFAVMLASLHEQGYAVEWRVINAADYGMPQRRRRTFILGFKKGTRIYNEMRDIKSIEDADEWLSKKGVIIKEFPIQVISSTISKMQLDNDITKVSKEFSKEKPTISPFENSGIMVNGNIYTVKVQPKYNGKKVTLGEILENEENVPEEFFIQKKDIERWDYLKGGKTEQRQTKDGYVYKYSEGSMTFPDDLANASRTIVTGEGGSSPSRFKHVVKTNSGRLRRLMPIELERLNMFPDNHTEGASDTKRAFIMGNALVVGVITKLGKALRKSM